MFGSLHETEMRPVFAGRLIPFEGRQGELKRSTLDGRVRKV